MGLAHQLFIVGFYFLTVSIWPIKLQGFLVSIFRLTGGDVSVVMGLVPAAFHILGRVSTLISRYLFCIPCSRMSGFKSIKALKSINLVVPAPGLLILPLASFEEERSF